ncbi:MULTISPECIES: hypothetical protein [Bacteria]|uniref:hypothetical protein n=1 Tax=Bacteria TaxID=2 RepID=UPI000621A8B6|nr:hypothetical protein [Leucobacter sp. Ag1]KKI20568.1 hypothetical protein XM48_07585 [Leucobacter sp. Ag1]
MQTITLDAPSLLNKWGFEDGDIIYRQVGDAEAIMEGHTKETLNDALVQLVREHLIPAVEAAGHLVTLNPVSTSHNPAVVSELDGMTVTDYTGNDNRLDGISVDVPADTVRAALAAVVSVSRRQ